MLIETLTFRLVAGADEAEFLEADRRVQTEFIPNQPGFARRTTARGADGEWLVVVLWWSEQEAEASKRLAEAHPATAEFISFVDSSTLRTNRYESLD